MEEAKTSQEAQSVLLITKDRVKGWDACHSGYRWFLEKFPQGGQFADVHSALQLDKRYDDSAWLLEKVFAKLDTSAKVEQTVLISGADRAKIEKAAADGAEAATTGEGANAATTGNWANAATTGEGANAATTGYRANAATTGEGANAATTGAHAVAAALGTGAKAKSGRDGAIMLVHRNSSGELLHVFASKVGENGIEPDTWYSLDASGNPVAEVSE